MNHTFKNLQQLEAQQLVLLLGSALAASPFSISS